MTQTLKYHMTIGKDTILSVIFSEQNNTTLNNSSYSGTLKLVLKLSRFREDYKLQLLWFATYRQPDAVALCP